MHFYKRPQNTRHFWTAITQQTSKIETNGGFCIIFTMYMTFINIFHIFFLKSFFVQPLQFFKVVEEKNGEQKDSLKKPAMQKVFNPGK
jgi:hypothetical protein